MLKHQYTPLAIATAVILYGNSLHAAETTELEQVVVTATRSSETISSISGTVQVITGEDIKALSQPGQKLADSLEKLVPGMGPSTQIATDRTQSLRGRKILVLIDGISQQDNRQVSRQLNSIRPENIDRIEVVSGASAIYGGGATGGIINIIIKNAGEDSLSFASEAGVKMSGSNLSTYTLHQSAQGRRGNFDFLLSGTFESRDAIYDSNGDRTNPDPSQVSRSDSDTKDALVKLGYNLDENKRFEATLQIFRDQMDTEYAPDYGDNLVRLGDKDAPISAPVKGLELDDQPYTNRDSLSLVFSDDDFFGSRLETQAYYRKREARFYPYAYDFRGALDEAFFPGANTLVDDDVVVNQSTSTSDVYGLKVVLDTEVNNDLRLSYGLDYDVDKGEQTARSYDDIAFVDSKGLQLNPEGSEYDYGPNVTAKTFGAFIQSSWDVRENVTLNLGWRHERANLDIDDYDPIAETWFIPIYSQPVFGQNGIDVAEVYTPLEGDTKKYREDLLNAGVVFRINDQNEVFVNYSEGYEVPDAARILRNAYSEDSVLADLNPAYTPGAKPTSLDKVNLDAIKTKNYELGWRGRFASFDTAVTLFYNKSDQTLDFNEDYSVDLLDQEKKIYGVEASLDYFLNDNWSLGGTYAFTEGRSHYEKIDKWLDLQAADVSPQKITAYLGYEQPGLNIRLQAINFADYNKGQKYTESSNTVTGLEVDGYTTFDLLASYHLPVGVLSAGITNLFNEDYETIYSQWARQTYDSLSAAKAEGRAYSLSYRVEY